MAEVLDPIVRAWITLLDSAEVLRRTAPGRDPGACDRVGKAVDLLLRHEHTMTDAQRALARRTVWLRDTPDEPLPDDPALLTRCTCSQCALARLRKGVMSR